VELSAFNRPIDRPRRHTFHYSRRFRSNHADVVGAGRTPGHDLGFRPANDNLPGRLHSDLSSSFDPQELQRRSERPVIVLVPTDVDRGPCLMMRTLREPLAERVENVLRGFNDCPRLFSGQLLPHLRSRFVDQCVELIGRRRSIASRQRLLRCFYFC